MNKLTISSMIFALALGGCGDDDRPGDMITLMDGGPGADSGPVGTDMGPGVDMGPGCPPASYPAPTEATCTMEQIEELQTASMESQEAVNAWFDANPDCGTCVNDGILACSTSNGCDDEFGLVNCCGQDECGAAADPQACFNAATSAGGACEGQVNTFISCVQGLPAGSCGIDPTCVM